MQVNEQYAGKAECQGEQRGSPRSAREQPEWVAHCHKKDPRKDEECPQQASMGIENLELKDPA